jgi:thiamine biosynthesis lipoprotein
VTTAPPALRIAVPETLDSDLLTRFDPKASVIEFGGATMGTSWRVKFALPGGHDPSGIAGAIQARLDGIVGQMSHWEESSLLCRFNNAEAGSWTALPQDFAAVIACGLDIAERSNGAYDPALGRLTDLWGLGPRRADSAPSDAEIAGALEYSGSRHLAFDAQNSRLRQPGGLWLDMSGIAKGYAVDAVADMLAGQGLCHALVEIGGECAGRGMRPDGEPWWVEAETPQGFAIAPLRVALCQLAIATSGDYLRGAHTLDPATGRPPQHPTTAVSVIHHSCMAADAWASALGVLSPARASALAEREGLAVRLLTRGGGEWLSSALLRML